MKLHARVSDLIFRSGRGRRSSSETDLALNFSFVLHDSSSSATVRQAVAAAQRISSQRARATNVVFDGDPTLPVSNWLSATIGLHEHLHGALTDAGLRADSICVVDRGENPRHTATFFRSEAALTLPTNQSGLIGVAALIVRPRGHTQQLIVCGPFNWPSEQPAALKSLEAIIQAHIEQWTPEARLWQIPAEIALPDEIEQLP